MNWTDTLLRAVLLVCLLFVTLACTSSGPKTDSLQLDTVPVFSADATGERFTQADGTERKNRKLICRTERPIGSWIPKSVCYWDDELERASEEGKRALNSAIQGGAPNQ